MEVPSPCDDSMNFTSLPLAPAATHDVNDDDLPIASAEQIPYDYCCPCTFELFVDPVVTADGQTYERRLIQDSIDRGNITSPITGLALAHTELVENIALRNVIQEWKTERASKKRVPVPNLVAPASLLRLSKHFQGLDLIREQLDAALDGWKPPVWPGVMRQIDPPGENCHGSLVSKRRGCLYAPSNFG